MLEWAQPWAGFLLLVPGVVWLLRRWVPGLRAPGQAEVRPVLYHPAARVLAAIAVKLPARRQERAASQVGFALWSLAWALMVVALMGPQNVHTSTSVKSEGVDVVLALDVSRSMLAMDLSPDWRNPMTRVTRLDEVKRVVKQFLDDRARNGGDRFGLVLFGEHAYVQSPLTLDGFAVAEMLSEAEVGIAGDATAIGDAMVLGVKLLKDRPQESRVMVLLTDGDNTAGTILPEDAARLVQEYGIRFYAIAIGRSDRVPYPEPGILGQTRVVMAEMPMDKAALKKVAQIAGGQFFEAGDPKSLEDIYDRIDQLERTEAESKTLIKRVPEFRPWLLAGLMVLGIGLALGRRFHAYG